MNWDIHRTSCFPKVIRTTSFSGAYRKWPFPSGYHYAGFLKILQVPSARPLFLRKHKPKQTPPPAVRPSIPICLPFVCRLQAVCKWCRAETPFQRTPSCSPLLQKADPPAKPAASIGPTRADCRHASQPNLILRVIPSAPQPGAAAEGKSRAQHAALPTHPPAPLAPKPANGQVRFQRQLSVAGASAFVSPLDMTAPPVVASILKDEQNATFAKPNHNI